MKNEALEYIAQVYEDNMWIRAKYKKALEDIVEKKGLSREEVKKIIDENIARLDGEKAFFAKHLPLIAKETAYYAPEELIYPVRKPVRLRIGSRYKHQRLSGEFRVVVSPYYDYPYHPAEGYTPFSAVVRAENRVIELDCEFDHEDRYNISVFYILDGQEILMLETCVYALEDDLACKQFYKADFHMHTTYSDGIEEPELVAASAREWGMDIIAVTDHNNFEGSVVAKQRAKELGLELTVILGEEYAFSFSPMHILALGTEKPIDRTFLSAALAKTETVRKIIREAEDVGCNVESYAYTQAVLDEVRRMGGISILAHPYWKPVYADGSRKDTPEQLFAALGKDKRFDGVELVSGSPYGEWNVANLQTSLVREMLGDFSGVPLIGITDSHRYTTDGICGKHFTIVAADSREDKDVIRALKEGSCVAVETVNGVPFCYGKHRLVKLADFLVRYYFPERDEDARAQARLVKKKYLMKQREEI